MVQIVVKRAVYDYVDFHNLQENVLNSFKDLICISYMYTHTHTPQVHSTWCLSTVITT